MRRSRHKLQVSTFPFLAVLIKYGPCMKVVWAILLQLIGHLPGVIYGIYQVTRNTEPTYY